MSSNARLSKPYSLLKAPRSTLNQFEVGTHKKTSHTIFSKTTLISRRRQNTKQLFAASMKTTLVYPKPETARPLHRLVLDAPKGKHGDKHGGDPNRPLGPCEKRKSGKEGGGSDEC